jgi:Dolichyl-phosphate-mannose-protein mannosyltransferase
MARPDIANSTWATLGHLLVTLGGKAGDKHVSLVDEASQSVAADTPVHVAGTTRGRAVDPDARFWFCMAGAVVLGAVVRFVYLFHGAPTRVGGDGLDYHLSALRLADGLGYTSALDPGIEYAHHPPGWVTLLGAVSEVGARSMWAHQVTGLVLGLGVILVTGLVGRRYVGRRIGVIAAFLAAAYPGFWVLDVQILSEPLGLLVLGLLMLAIAGLWERPTLARALGAGVLTGVLALVRSEQLALLALVVAPVLLLNRRISPRRRLVWTAAAGLTSLVMIAPWTIHNLNRFEEPVLLSTNAGSTLLTGNCPPTTYSGEDIGAVDIRCTVGIAMRNPDFDRSQVDIEARHQAFDNMRGSLDRLPATVLARFGRLLAVFRPAHTIGIDVTWLNSATWPVWAWVASFWLVLPLAIFGFLLLRRSKRFYWPLVAPVVIVVLVTAIAFGDPRYHTPADLGVLVLAAVAVDRLMRRRPRTDNSMARSPA